MTQPPSQAPSSATSSASRALLAVAMQFFVNGVLWASVAARLPEVRDRSGVTVAGLGLILTLGGAAGLVGSGLAGRIVERWGTRRVMLVGNVGLVAAVLTVAWSTDAAVLVVGFSLMSFSDVLVDIAMNLQGSWLSARRHAPVMNRLHGLWSLGTVVGGLGAAVAASAGVALTTQTTTVAALCVVLVTAVSRGLLRTDEHHADEPADDAGAAPRRTMWLLALAGAFALVMEQTASDWAPFRLSDDFGASAGWAGLAYVAFTAGMTLARFGGDSAQARLGREGLHHIAVMLAIGGLVAASFGPARWLVLIGYAVAGCGIATFFPRIYDDAARVPGRRGAGLGAMTAGSRLAGFIAPSIVGALAATSLSVGDAVAIVTLPCAAGFVVVMSRSRRTAAPG